MKVMKKHISLLCLTIVLTLATVSAAACSRKDKNAESGGEGQTVIGTQAASETETGSFDGQGTGGNESGTEGVTTGQATEESGGGTLNETDGGTGSVINESTDTPSGMENGVTDSAKDAVGSSESMTGTVR